MIVRLKDLSLRHIDPTKLLLERDYPESDSPPAWFEEITEGSASARGWINGTVMATLETRFHRPNVMYVGVAVTGMYATDEQMGRKRATEVDTSTIDNATEDERREFIQRALIDLYPSLRAELQILSSRFNGIAGISLQPNPLLEN